MRSFLHPISASLATGPLSEKYSRPCGWVAAGPPWVSTRRLIPIERRGSASGPPLGPPTDHAATPRPVGLLPYRAPLSHRNRPPEDTPSPLVLCCRLPFFLLQDTPGIFSPRQKGLGGGGTRLKGKLHVPFPTSEAFPPRIRPHKTLQTFAYIFPKIGRGYFITRVS